MIIREQKYTYTSFALNMHTCMYFICLSILTIREWMGSAVGSCLYSASKLKRWFGRALQAGRNYGGPGDTPPPPHKMPSIPMGLLHKTFTGEKLRLF